MTNEELFIKKMCMPNIAPQLACLLAYRRTGVAADVFGERVEQDNTNFVLSLQNSGRIVIECPPL